MSKLSRKRVRTSGPVISTQLTNSDVAYQARPSPHDRNEVFFRRQLDAAIQESKDPDYAEVYGKSSYVGFTEIFPNDIYLAPEISLIRFVQIRLKGGIHNSSIIYY